MGPYAKHGSQWVSFDDQEMIKHKSEFVLYNNLGGAMIWALDLDDFRYSEMYNYFICYCNIISPHIVLYINSISSLTIRSMTTIMLIFCRNTCGCEKYPLLKTINQVLRNYTGYLPQCYLESDARKIPSTEQDNHIKPKEKPKWKFDNCLRGEVRTHPSDCTKYITCTFDSFPQEQTCPPGLHFNPVIIV